MCLRGNILTILDGPMECINLGSILKFVTGTDEEPSLLGFKLNESIMLSEVESFVFMFVRNTNVKIGLSYQDQVTQYISRDR